MEIDNQQQQQAQQQQVQQQMQQQQFQQPAIDVNAITATLNGALDRKLGAFEQRILEQQQAQAQQMTPEQREEMNFKLREQFENDPMAFMDKLKGEAEQNAINKLNKQYAPILEQTKHLNNKLQWQENVRNFLAQNPQAEAYQSQMAMVLRENPALMNTRDPLKTAYQIATSNDLVGNGGNLIENLLNNQSYKDQLLNNEALRTAIISDYQNKLNGSTNGSNVPPIMGNNQSGSTIPASSGEQPRNLKEAKAQALRRIQMMGM